MEPRRGWGLGEAQSGWSDTRVALVLAIYPGPAHCGSSDGNGKKEKIESSGSGTYLVVQQFRLSTSNAGGTGSIPSQGTKILHAIWSSKRKRKKKKKSSGSLDWSRGPAANVATVFGKMGASGLALPSLPSTHQLPERYAKYSI